MQYPIYSGILAGAGWQWVNPPGWLAACGCYGRKRFAGIFPQLLSNAGVMRNVGLVVLTSTLAAPQIHLLSGATMLGAFLF